jgi:hypothetical protein
MVWQAAIVRSLYGGLVTGAAAGIGVYATNNQARGALVAGAGVFLAYLLSRGLAEGLIDNSKALTIPNPPAASLH